jgi:hypothetical protein
MNYSIIVCRGCRKKFRIYMHEVYPGDTRYCRKCNKESEEETEYRKA